MFRRIYHTSFTVSDMDRSLEFYRDLLGMKVVGDQGGRGGYLATVTGFPEVDLRVVFLKTTETSEDLLELIEYRAPKGEKADVRTCNSGAAHLCFEVDDIHEEYERLKSAGVRFKSPPNPIPGGRHRGGYLVYMLDPDDITLELMQLPAQGGGQR